LCFTNAAEMPQLSDRKPKGLKFKSSSPERRGEDLGGEMENSIDPLLENEGRNYDINDPRHECHGSNNHLKVTSGIKSKRSSIMRFLTSNFSKKNAQTPMGVEDDQSDQNRKNMRIAMENNSSEYVSDVSEIERLEKKTLTVKSTVKSEAQS
jgi:hypothetical protein